MADDFSLQMRENILVSDIFTLIVYHYQLSLFANKK